MVHDWNDIRYWILDIGYWILDSAKNVQNFIFNVLNT